MNNMNKIIKYMGNNPNSPITLRSIIDAKFAFRIIGSGGNVHQFIQTTHEVKLYLHNDADRFGRLCSVAGPVANVAQAYREILCIIFKRRLDLEKMRYVWLKLLIPSELAYKLQSIPAKSSSLGCVLNDIASVTSTHITIEPSPIVNTTEHILEISLATTNDYLDRFTKALTLVGQQFQRYRHEALSPKNIYYTPFCYERSPILDDDDDDDDISNTSANESSDSGQPGSKDKGVATFNPLPTIAPSSPPPPQQLVTSSSSSSSSPLSPIISQASTMAISPTSLVSHLDHTTITTTTDHYTCQ